MAIGRGGRGPPSVTLTTGGTSALEPSVLLLPPDPETVGSRPITPPELLILSGGRGASTGVV